jgi:hypothetical protein
LFLDPPSLLENCRGAAEIDIGGCDIAETLVDPAVIVVIDERADGGLEGAGR